MPQVRFGPDITDDAAKIMNNIVDYQKRLKKNGKLTKREAAAYKRERAIAKRLFGLTDKDIDRKNFKLMRDLAKYGVGGRDARGRSYKRNKFAKRNGVIRRRTVKKESEIASLGQRRRTYTKDSDKFGGASFLGRTNPKGLQKAMKKFDNIQKRRGGASYEGRRVKKIRPQAAGGKEDINRLMGARTRGKPGPSSAARLDRPRLVRQRKKASAASKRAKGANKKRKAAVKRATRPKRPKATRTRRK